jgi:hypothetical protein
MSHQCPALIKIFNALATWVWNIYELPTPLPNCKVLSISLKPWLCFPPQVTQVSQEGYRGLECKECPYPSGNKTLELRPLWQDVTTIYFSAPLVKVRSMSLFMNTW